MPWRRRTRSAETTHSWWWPSTTGAMDSGLARYSMTLPTVRSTSCWPTSLNPGSQTATSMVRSPLSRPDSGVRHRREKQRQFPPLRHRGLERLAVRRAAREGASASSRFSGSSVLRWRLSWASGGSGGGRGEVEVRRRSVWTWIRGPVSSCWKSMNCSRTHARNLGSPRRSTTKPRRNRSAIRWRRPRRK